MSEPVLKNNHPQTSEKRLKRAKKK